MKDTCIIVLYYNKINHTKTCIDSILNSGYNPDHILSFDNGSIIENYNFIRKTFPQVKHNRSEINKGYSGGFNNAIKWAIEIGFNNFLFCTNDTKVFPETLNAILNISQDSNAFLIVPKIVYNSDINKIDSIGGYFDNKKFILNHYKENDLPVVLNTKTDYIPGTAFWLTADVFNELNGMDESYNTYWEDVDFSFRAHKAGIKILRCYEALITHGVGKTCHKKPLYSTYYFQRNRIKFCKKYCPKIEWENAKKIILADLNIFETKWKNNNDRIRLEYLEMLYKELKNNKNII